MSELKVPETRTLHIDQIVPYWRNPRRVSSESVNAIAESIRQFGYQQPIVVDEENVIIIGHTRYSALRRLDVTQVEVLVASDLDPEAVKQLRIIDNKAAEFSIWDYNLLQGELAEMDQKLVQQYFFELAGAPSEESVIDVNAENAAAAEDDEDLDDDLKVDFICPTCFHSWEREVTHADVMKGRIV